MRAILKNQREKLGYTQAEIAKKIGIARTSYTNIELGNKNPSLSVAMKIKNILQYSNDDIFHNINKVKE